MGVLLGKNILVAAFLITSLVSLVLFFAREDNSLRDQVDARSKQPVISLEEFVVFRYSGHALSSTISARMANFLEPNVVELYGDINSKRYTEGKEDYLAAESATAYLSSHGITQFMKDNSVSKAQLESDVRIGVGDNVVSTEFAEYLKQNELLRSEQPVMVYGPTGKFRGNTGFEYELKTEKMTLFGPIEGLLQEGRIPGLD